MNECFFFLNICNIIERLCDIAPYLAGGLFIMVNFFRFSIKNNQKVKIKIKATLQFSPYAERF